MPKSPYIIGICDDEEYWRQEITNLCNMKCKELEIQPEYLLFSTGKELLQSEKELDLLFLDEELPEVSGLEVKEAYDEYHFNTMIIFVTSHEEILYESFGKNVYGFLNKPVDCANFSKLFNRIIKKMERHSYSQSFISLNNDKHIPCADILYISAEGSYSKIVMCSGDSVILRKEIGELDNEITYKYFVRIHKSYIVNLMQKCTLEHSASSLSFVANPSVIVPVARRRKKELQRLYAEALLERANMIWNL